MLDRPHIFLSFKTEERHIAAKLKDVLTAAGYVVWWQESIQCGKEWHADLDIALSEAGCVIVLWSAASMQSPWVRHEASQAIARNNYAPARIDSTAVDTPYDHIQASNLADWSGSADHPGFVGLIARIEELMPSRRTLVTRFWRRNRWTIASVLFAAAAVALLVQLTTGLNSQLKAQSAIATEIQRTLQPLDGFNVSAYLTLSPSIPGVREYESALRKTLGRDENGKYAIQSPLPPGVFPVVSDSSGRQTVLSISKDSRLWPSPAEFPILAAVVDYAELSLSFRRQTRASGAPNPALDDDSWADLLFQVGSYDPDGSERQQPRVPRLDWHIDERRMSLQFDDVPAKRWWKSNGMVVSVPDVADSLLRVRIRSTTYPAASDRASIDSARSGLLLDILFLDYSGRGIILRANEMAQQADEHGLMVYSGLVSRAASR